jgi:hypothetical protein
MTRKQTQEITKQAQNKEETRTTTQHLAAEWRGGSKRKRMSARKKKNSKQ